MQHQRKSSRISFLLSYTCTAVHSFKVKLFPKQQRIITAAYGDVSVLRFIPLAPVRESNSGDSNNGDLEIDQRRILEAYSPEEIGAILTGEIGTSISSHLSRSTSTTLET